MAVLPLDQPRVEFAVFCFDPANLVSEIIQLGFSSRSSKSVALRTHAVSPMI